ncbi:efflux RND transporter periplasmic adaptor subunit [Photobacterium phosphoreum]|nr:efflux RND transporter periplasmic adaptor subunit [Photobacterium phosphoreum]
MEYKSRILIGILAFPMMFTTLSSLANEPATTLSIPIKIQNIKNRTFNQDFQEVGKITAVDSTALTFSASEKLITKCFSDGAYVHKGEVIAKLDSTQPKAELQKSETQYAIERSKLHRMLALIQKQPDAISKQDIENQKLQTHLVQVDVQQKKDDLLNYQLIAPFNGRLTNFKYSIGSRISADDVVVSLIKNDPVKVAYSISQQELAQAASNQQVTISVDAYKNKRFTGVVNYIAPEVDSQSGRIDVQANIKNTDKLLIPGMFAKVTQHSAKNITYPIVSQTAVIVDGDKRYVWLYDGSKGVKQQPVVLGDNTNDGYVVIKQGVDVNDKVVVAGQQNLKPDSLVKLQTSTAPALPLSSVKKAPQLSSSSNKPMQKVTESSNQGAQHETA